MGGPHPHRPALTQDEVQLGVSLEGVVQRDQEGGLAHQLSSTERSVRVCSCVLARCTKAALRSTFMAYSLPASCPPALLAGNTFP